MAAHARCTVGSASRWGLAALAVLALACGGGSKAKTTTSSQSCTGAACAATLTSIAIAPATASVAAGASQAFTATALFSDGTTADVSSTATWSSSDDSVAIFTGAGAAKGVKAGAVTVTATAQGVSGTAQLQVTPAAASSVSVSCASLTLASGTGTACTAYLLFGDGSKQDVTGSAAWTSSAGSVATVAAGAVSGVAPGTATISAAAGGLTGSATVTVTSAVLDALAVGPDLQTIPIGVQLPFAATGIFSDGTQQDLTSQVSWTTGNPAVATISGAGLATAVGQGSTTVTATLGAQTASASLAVTAVALQGIDVFATVTSFAKGTSVTLTAQGNYSDGTTQDLTAQAAWSSSAAAVTLSAAGGQELATGAEVGPATVTASVAGVSGTLDLAVTPATLVSIAVAPPTVSVPAGLSQQLTATGTFTDGSTQDLTAQAAWSSSDPTLASVSNDPATAGLVSALKQGTVTITAAALGASSAATFTVSAAAVTAIAVTPATATIAAGYQLQFHAAATFTDGSSRDVTAQAVWTSSNGAVATVYTSGSSPGLATGLSIGTANIKAALDGQMGSATLTVTSARLWNLVIAPSPFTVAVKGKVALTATGTFSDGSTANVTRQCSWSSTAKSIAWVSKNGVVTGVSAGAVTINARRGSVRAPGVAGTVQ
ncbi:MAG TPA: Ig-like domain-containing protein [Anaeromyxobacteraceae bacterium]|jgi:hypothetical protein|nr:Ig-like domain-containing protein [Anaeromyxobacteraceae bacterium]